MTPSVAKPHSQAAFVDSSRSSCTSFLAGCHFVTCSDLTWSYLTWSYILYCMSMVCESNPIFRQKIFFVHAYEKTHVCTGNQGSQNPFPVNHQPRTDGGISIHLRHCWHYYWSAMASLIFYISFIPLYRLHHKVQNTSSLQSQTRFNAQASPIPVNLQPRTGGNSIYWSWNADQLLDVL